MPMPVKPWSRSMGSRLCQVRMRWLAELSCELKMVEKRVIMLSGRKGMMSGIATKPMGMSRLST